WTAAISSRVVMAPPCMTKAPTRVRRGRGGWGLVEPCEPSDVTGRVGLVRGSVRSPVVVPCSRPDDAVGPADGLAYAAGQLLDRPGFPSRILGLAPSPLELLRVSHGSPPYRAAVVRSR